MARQLTRRPVSLSGRPATGHAASKSYTEVKKLLAVQKISKILFIFCETVDVKMFSGGRRGTAHQRVYMSAPDEGFECQVSSCPNSGKEPECKKRRPERMEMLNCCATGHRLAGCLWLHLRLDLAQRAPQAGSMSPA